MIKVTRLDNSKVLINVGLIQTLQATPDTIITFTSSEKMIVKEPVEELSKKILDYQRSIYTGMPFFINEGIEKHAPYS